MIKITLILSIAALISASNQSKEITLKWDDHSDNEDGFCLEYLNDQMGMWTAIDSIGMNITEYGPISLSVLDTHFFRIYAYNDIGNSGFSNILPVFIDDFILNTPVIAYAEKTPQNHIQLTWMPVENASAYHVYRSTDAFFIPDQAEGSNRIAVHVSDVDPVTEGVQWIDTQTLLGNPEQNYFYAVSATHQDIESECSPKVGKFDFSLYTSSTTSFNEIALPLSMYGIHNAEDLMSSIPGCNSVARWDASIQAYEQYVPGIPPTNFSVEMGYPYYVNVTEDSVFTLMGEIIQPSFYLITTSTTNFNEIMLPLDKTYILKASDLMTDIPNCNSVAYWDVNTQAYQQYVPGIPFTDFDIKTGYPYYVNVTSEVVWPEGGSSFKTITQKDGAQEGIGSRAPHVACGQFHSDQNDGNQENVHFQAYIESRPEEILTDHSAGCMYEKGYWVVQCQSFRSAWKAGDVLHVLFENEFGHHETDKQIELTYNAVDELDDSPLEDFNNTPTHYQLGYNYPNPFNSRTVIPFQLPENGRVRITIYNMLGQEIKKLVDEDMEPGSYEVIWDGRDMYQSVVSSNVYLVRMESGTYTDCRRIIFIQ